MASTSGMIATFGAAALAACLVSCEKEAEKPAPPSASSPTPAASISPAASAAPIASAVEKKPSHPCPDSSTGKGTFDDPCKAKGKTRIMDVSWNKKIEDTGPTFKIINNAKLEVLYGKAVVYF